MVLLLMHLFISLLLIYLITKKFYNIQPLEILNMHLVLLKMSSKLIDTLMLKVSLRIEFNHHLFLNPSLFESFKLFSNFLASLVSSRHWQNSIFSLTCARRNSNLQFPIKQQKGQRKRIKIIVFNDSALSWPSR